jgi:hypothetical protein
MASLQDRDDPAAQSKGQGKPMKDITVVYNPIYRLEDGREFTSEREAEDALAEAKIQRIATSLSAHMVRDRPCDLSYIPTVIDWIFQNRQLLRWHFDEIGRAAQREQKKLRRKKAKASLPPPPTVYRP